MTAAVVASYPPQPGPPHIPNFSVRLATSAARPASRPVRPAPSCAGRHPLKTVPQEICAASRMPPRQHRHASTTTHVGHRRDKRAPRQWVPPRDASLLVPHAPLHSLSPVIPTPHRTKSALTLPTPPFVSPRHVHRCPRVAVCRHQSADGGSSGLQRLRRPLSQAPPLTPVGFAPSGGVQPQTPRRYPRTEAALPAPAASTLLGSAPQPPASMVPREKNGAATRLLHCSKTQCRRRVRGGDGDDGSRCSVRQHCSTHVHRGRRRRHGWLRRPRNGGGGGGGDREEEVVEKGAPRACRVVEPSGRPRRLLGRAYGAGVPWACQVVRWPPPLFLPPSPRLRRRHDPLCRPLLSSRNQRRPHPPLSMPQRRPRQRCRRVAALRCRPPPDKLRPLTPNRPPPDASGAVRRAAAGTIWRYRRPPR